MGGGRMGVGSVIDHQLVVQLAYPGFHVTRGFYISCISLSSRCHIKRIYKWWRMIRHCLGESDGMLARARSAVDNFFTLINFCINFLPGCSGNFEVSETRKLKRTCGILSAEDR